MSDEQAQHDVHSRRQLEDLTARVTADEAAIKDLKHRADASSHRADATEARASESSQRADLSEAAAVEDRRDVAVLTRRVDVDEEVIARLLADEVLDREHVANLQVALRTSRRIGAALGIIMAARKVDEEAAFEVLRKVSQDTNRKVQAIADDLVRTGDVSDLVGSKPESVAST